MWQAQTVTSLCQEADGRHTAECSEYSPRSSLKSKREAWNRQMGWK